MSQTEDVAQFGTSSILLVDAGREAYNVSKYVPSPLLSELSIFMIVKSIKIDCIALKRRILRFYI